MNAALGAVVLAATKAAAATVSTPLSYYHIVHAHTYTCMCMCVGRCLSMCNIGVSMCTCVCTFVCVVRVCMFDLKLLINKSKREKNLLLRATV